MPPCSINVQRYLCYQAVAAVEVWGECVILFSGHTVLPHRFAALALPAFW